MFNSAILDVAIGMVLSFLAVSLAASAITEAISSWGQWREKTLADGIQALLNYHPEDHPLALDLYKSALISPLTSGTAKSLEDIKHKPWPFITRWVGDRRQRARYAPATTGARAKTTARQAATASAARSGLPAAKPAPFSRAGGRRAKGISEAVRDKAAAPTSTAPARPRLSSTIRARLVARK